MDVSTVVGLISSVGFPIVACVGMAKYMFKTMESNNKRIDELQQLRTAEMLEVIKQNSEVMARMCEKLDSICK